MSFRAIFVCFLRVATECLSRRLLFLKYVVDLKSFLNNQKGSQDDGVNDLNLP